jgi:hypothetical protein
LQPCPYYSWSGLNIKDILKRLRDAGGARWDCLPDLEAEKNNDCFTAQMHAEVCLREKDAQGRKKRRYVPVSQKRPNHWWDCEAMQIVCAAIARVIGDTPPPEPGAANDEEKKDETTVTE